MRITAGRRIRAVIALVALTVVGQFSTAVAANAYPASATGQQPAITTVTSTVCALSSDGKTVSRYAGNQTWTFIGGPAATLYGGGYGLFTISPVTGVINRYVNGGWQQIGGPGAAFAVTGDAVYGLSTDRSAVWQYSGSGQGWSQIGGPARTIVACP